MHHEIHDFTRLFLLFHVKWNNRNNNNSSIIMYYFSLSDNSRLYLYHNDSVVTNIYHAVFGKTNSIPLSVLLLYRYSTKLHNYCASTTNTTKILLQIHSRTLLLLVITKVKLYYIPNRATATLRLPRYNNSNT